MQKLDQITIEDLCRRARDSGLEYGESGTASPEDFTI
jgi:hypothetical protein